MRLIAGRVSTGEASVDDDAASKAQMEKTEISLTLSNKFEVPEHEQSDAHSQLIRSDPVFGASRYKNPGERSVLSAWCLAAKFAKRSFRLRSYLLSAS